MIWSACCQITTSWRNKKARDFSRILITRLGTYLRNLALTEADNGFKYAMSDLVDLSINHFMAHYELEGNG